MDLKTVGTKAAGWIKKYRYAVLILAIGVALMLIPGKKNTQQTTTEPQTQIQTQQQDVAGDLAQILGQIQGVGQVKVMLTVSAGEKTIYQEDSDVTTGETSSSIRKETVIITDSGKTQQALISQVIPPTYLGAIVVCQGGDLASVKMAVMDAVSKATGLPADKISVLKMK